MVKWKLRELDFLAEVPALAASGMKHLRTRLPCDSWRWSFSTLRWWVSFTCLLQSSSCLTNQQIPLCFCAWLILPLMMSAFWFSSLAMFLGRYWIESSQRIYYYLWIYVKRRSYPFHAGLEFPVYLKIFEIQVILCPLLSYYDSDHKYKICWYLGFWMMPFVIQVSLW